MRYWSIGLHHFQEVIYLLSRGRFFLLYRRQQSSWFLSRLLYGACTPVAIELCGCGVVGLLLWQDRL